MRHVATGQLTIVDTNDYISTGATAPSNPVANITLWVDTSVTPNQLKKWDGTKWVIVNEVIVGGRNLAKFSTIPGTIVPGKFNNNKGKEKTFTANGNWRIQGWTSSEAGLYSLGFWIKSSVANTQISVDVCDSNNKNITLTAADTWYWFSNEAMTVVNYLGSPYYGFVDIGVLAICTCTICNFKLEKGNKATDWTEAPEDTAAEIENTYTKTTTFTSTIDALEDSIALKVSSITYQTDQLAVSTRLNAAEVKITDTAINQTVKSQIDSTSAAAVAALKIGGRNLLRNSSNFTTLSYWQNATLYTVDGKLCLGAEYYGTNEKIFQQIFSSLKLNTDYTLSCMVKTEGANQEAFIGSGTYIKKDIPAASVFTKFTWTFNTGAFSMTLVRFDANGAGASVKSAIYVYDIKLEEGNKNTDWSPAPEDVVSTTTYEAGLTILNASIATKVSQLSFDALNSTVTTHSTAITQLPTSIDARITTQTQAGGIIKTQVESWFTLSENILSLGAKSVNITGATVFSSLATNDSVTNAVNAVQVGTRNLLLSSNGILNAQGYLLGSYAYSTEVTVGKVYSITICYTLGANNVAIGAYWDDGFAPAGASFSSKGDKQIITIIGTYNTARPLARRMHFFQFPNGAYGSTIHWAIMVEGNKPVTLWTPAPEDVNTAISTAQTVAVTTSRNNLATSLGYADYSAMEAQAIAGNTIINGGMIRTSLINAQAIVTGSLVASIINTTDITTGRLTVTDGAKIGGFSVGSNRIGSVASATGSGGTMALYDNFFRVGGNDGYVFLGNNVIPASAGGAFNATGRIVNQTINTGASWGYDACNTGLYISVTGGTKNFGIDSNAALKAPAFIGTKIKYLFFGSTYTVDFSQYSTFIIDATTTRSVTLPTESAIAKQFSLSSLPYDFGFVCTMVHAPTGGDIILNGLTDWNNDIMDVRMAVGDIITLLVTKYPSFHYQILNLQQ